MKSSHTNKIKALLLVCFCYAGAVRSQTYPLEAPGSASPCQIDVKCSEGSSLSIQKDAVNLYYHMDSYQHKSLWGGTCFLLNDASSIPRGLLMTANHVIANITDDFVRFYAYRSSCNGTDPDINNPDIIYLGNNNWAEDTVVDDIRLAQLHFANIPLGCENGPCDYKWTTRLGWSLLDPTQSSGKSVGHPNGNPMKVTLVNNIRKDSSFYGTYLDVWKGSVYKGLLENGQSGSPLFNSENYVIGLLNTTDTVICQNSSTKASSGTGNFSRLSAYYRALSKFLDPDQTGAVQVPTVYYDYYQQQYVELGSYKYPSLNTTTNVVCSSQPGYVTVNNFCEFMEGHTTWSFSNPSLVSSQVLENGKKLKVWPATSSSSGSCTVTATIDFGSFSKSYSKTIWVGIPDVYTIKYDSGIPITTMNYVSPNTYHTVYLDLNNAIQANLQGYVNWNPSPTIGYANGQFYYRYDFSLQPNQSIYFNPVSASNQCGTAYRTMVFTGMSSYVYYPNPVSNTLTLEFDNAGQTDILPEEIQIYDEGSLSSPVKQFSVKDLLSKNGSKDGDKIALDVRDLPKGMYYVHLIYGKETGIPAGKIKIIKEK